MGSKGHFASPGAFFFWWGVGKHTNFHENDLNMGGGEDFETKKDYWGSRLGGDDMIHLVGKNAV